MKEVSEERARKEIDKSGTVVHMDARFHSRSFSSYANMRAMDGKTKKVIGSITTVIRCTRCERGTCTEDTCQKTKNAPSTAYQFESEMADRMLETLKEKGVKVTDVVFDNNKRKSVTKKHYPEARYNICVGHGIKSVNEWVEESKKIITKMKNKTKEEQEEMKAELRPEVKHYMKRCVTMNIANCSGDPEKLRNMILQMVDYCWDQHKDGVKHIKNLKETKRGWVNENLEVYNIVTGVFKKRVSSIWCRDHCRNYRNNLNESSHNKDRLILPKGLMVGPVHFQRRMDFSTIRWNEGEMAIVTYLVLSHPRNQCNTCF